MLARKSGKAFSQKEKRVSGVRVRRMGASVLLTEARPPTSLVFGGWKRGLNGGKAGVELRKSEGRRTDSLPLVSMRTLTPHRPRTLLRNELPRGRKLVAELSTAILLCAVQKTLVCDLDIEKRFSRSTNSLHFIYIFNVMRHDHCRSICTYELCTHIYTYVCMYF